MAPASSRSPSPTPRYATCEHLGGGTDFKLWCTVAEVEAGKNLEVYEDRLLAKV